MEHEEQIDRLYGAPLDEFVSQRGELAKGLRDEGEREAAERVKALRKPTLGAWALNQAVRRRQRERDELLSAGQRLRDAHEALLAGGDQAAVREAVKAERALVMTLADTAEAIASEAGKGGSALKERLRETLHAAAVDEQVREQLAAGRLVREHEAVGLGSFGGALAASGTTRRRDEAAKDAGAAGSGRGGKGAAAGKGGGAGKAGTTSKREREAERKREAAAAQREQAERLAAAEQELGDARAVEDDARIAHGRTAEELEQARDALDEAKTVERDARRALRECAEAAAKLERVVKRLKAAKP